MRFCPLVRLAGVALLGAALMPAAAQASSHREAPGITASPKVDGADFYMFRSYEPGRAGYVTLVADYVPLQDPYGGPNYFALDPAALYEIHVDNDGDAKENVTFQFRVANARRDLAIPAGGVPVRVPVMNLGQVGVGGDPADTSVLNVEERYQVSIIRGDRRKGRPELLTNSANGQASFRKPVDRIGDKSLPDYEAYADAHVYDVDIPGCAAGRVFVGQRLDPFVVNLGEVFDLVNTNPLGPENGEFSDLDDKNVTSFILEVPATCLVAADPVIGAWTTASLLDDGGRGGQRPAQQSSGPASFASNSSKDYRQVSRLGNPLVNEVVIGLSDKDRFNASEPRNDAQFATYVTNPSLPEIVEVLFPVFAPNMFPRVDLVQIFLTGINTPATGNLNQPAGVRAAEMLRLNTAVPVTAAAAQARLGVIGGDLAGFPNGRRPGDDVVDIALRAVMGRLITLGLYGVPADAPSGGLNYTDGASVDASMFPAAFPYLVAPLPGSPN